MVMLDDFAEWGWTVGDYCRPAGERILAGAKGVGAAAFMAFGGQIVKGVGGALLKKGVKVASTGGDIGAGQTVRVIEKGEKAKNLIDELAEKTYLSDGSEHAIISLKDGQRLMVKGGGGGIDFGGYKLKRVIIHTHPSPTGPSPLDFKMLEQTGQGSSYIYELFGGGLTKFYPK